LRLAGPMASKPTPVTSTRKDVVGGEEVASVEEVTASGKFRAQISANVKAHKYDIKNPDQLERRAKAWGMSDLVYQDVAFSIFLKKEKKEKVILEPTSGYVPNASLTAIMGPSGCGKSTLLDMLADKKTAKYTGDIQVNGRKRDKLFPRIASYIPQADVMHAHLTVKETISFNFRMKNSPPKYLTVDLRLKLLDVILEDVGLLSVKDSYIGSTEVRGISGGQRRRVTLARGLVALPQIIFADEPTSGLSATDSEQCVRALLTFAKTQGVCVLTVIHQPRVEITRLFDTLVLLTSHPGRLVYNAPMVDTLAYWEKAGFKVPNHANPTDYYLDLVTPGSPLDETEHFVKLYKSEIQPKVADEVQQHLNKEGMTTLEILNKVRDNRSEVGGDMPPIRDSRYGIGYFAQFKVVLARKLILTRRDRRQVVTKFGASLFQGVFLGLAFFNVASNSIQNQLGFYFMLLQVGALSNMSIMPLLIDERTIMKLEVSDALYGQFIWIAVISLVDTILSVAANLLFTVLMFAISQAGWENFGDVYPWSLYNFILFSSLFMAIAAIARTGSTAIQTAMPIVLLFIIYNGFFVTRASVEPWLVWLIWISPVAYSLEQIACTIFPDSPIIDLNGYICTDRQTVIAVVVMLLEFIMFRIAHVILLRKLNNIQR